MSNGSSKKTSESSDKQKRKLTQEIKDKITAELAQIKKGKTIDAVNEILSSGFRFGPDGTIFWNDEQEKALLIELEPTGYNEIVNLIKVEIRDTANNKKMEIEREIEEKLKNQPDLFYCP